MIDPGAGDEEAAGGAAPGLAASSQRLDKWLWFARVAKTRSLAQRLIAGGCIRVNRLRTDKASHALKLGDVVTIAVADRVRILEVRAPGIRRGPPAEAQTLYADLTPPRDADPGPSAPVAHPMADAPRPDKRARRQLGRLERPWPDGD